MKYHLFKKLAALGMAASVSLSAIAPAFAETGSDNSSEELVAEAENPDSDTETETPSDEGEETPPSNEDSSNNNDGEETLPSNEDTSSKDDGEETPPSDEDSSNKNDGEQSPSSGDSSNNNEDGEQPPSNEDNSSNNNEDGEQPPSDEDTSNKDDGEQTPPNKDTSNNDDGEQTPPSNENTSNNDEEQIPSNEDTSNNSGEQTPSNEDTSGNSEEQTPSTSTSNKLEGYEHVTQAGGKGDSLVTLEIVNDGSGDDKDPDNPGGGGGDKEDPDNPGDGGDDKDPDNPGGGGGGDKEDPDNPDNPEPMIFSAYVPSKLPMKLTEDGTVLTPSNAAIINGVATKGIAVKDIEAHLDYDWAPEDWDADYSSMEVNTKNVGLKLRGDTLSKDGDFSVNAEDWKIPKDSYIDLNMEAKLPPQKIETATQNSDVAVLSFTLDWSGDDTTTGPKWEGGTLNPDKPDDTSSKPKMESTDTIVSGGSGSINVTWDAKGDIVTLTSVTSSNTDVASIGDTTGSNGNKTVTINGLKGGTSTITATLSNGEKVTYEVTVYEVENPDDIKVTVSSKDFNVGDTITSNDVTVSVPLIAPDGSTKTITVKPSIDMNTLQAGNNSLTGTVTVGGQDYPIHFDVTVENPDSNKSGIKAESNDTLIAGETGNVKFTWDTKGNTITLTGVSSSNESVTTVGTITGADGSKTVTINALAYGTSIITATLSNGETATFEAEVYKVGNANDIQVTVNNQDLGIGDKVTSNDITVKVPIISPDGETKFIERTPSIEDKVLQAGDNTITGTVKAGNATYNITVTLTVEETSIPISVTSTTYIVGNESNPINFQWDTKDGSIILSEVTSSNTEVAAIKTTTGDEGNKTVDLDCLKAGTTNIELTFSNGSTASSEIIVYEVGNLDDTQVVIADKEFNAGDILSPDDVTVKVPLVDGEGNTKMVDMSVNFEDTTLKSGTNNFTVNLTIGGQTHPINFAITTEISNSNKSGIKAESNDTLVAGGTGNIVFTWNVKGDTNTLTSVTSSNTDVATVGNTAGSEGNKTTTLNALKGGTATITATLSNGETATFEATVYEMGNPDDIQTTVNNKDLGVGDKVTPNDVTVKVPLTAPDGSTKLVEVTPSIEDKSLTAGDSTLTGTVNVGGKDYPISFDVTAELPDDMKSGITVEANDLLVAGGDGNVNFKWDTKGNTVTLNSVTSSNQNVASVGTISGTEGNKTAAVNGLQSGVSTITATLSNGETASVDVPIHTVDTEKEIQVEVANKEFTEGDVLEPEDVTVKVPLTAPDGSTKYIAVHPTIEDTELEEGENTLTGTANVGGINLNITINVNVEGGTTTNPSDGLVMSVQEAQANGFTFGIYKEGVEITGFQNVNFKSTINVPSQIGDFMVLKVGDNVFQNQTNLKEITLPNSVTEIGNSAFAGCSSLAKFDTNKVTDIGTNAFANCTKMKTLTIPKCTTIGRSAFDGCTSLTELNTNRVSEIGYGAFANCIGLKKVTFGNKLTSIGEKAFSDCAGLTELNTNNVVSIGANAFDSCDGLETLVLGENLTSIGSNAFNYCDSLTDVEINNPNTTLGTDVFSNCDVSLLVPLEVVNTGTFAGQGQQGVSELNMKIVQETKLADNALEQCRFATIILPNGTTAIGNYSFANSKLKSITIPNGVTSIGNSAFINSASLSSVTFPDTLTSLGADSFKACTSFKEITLPNSLTDVGANTFADCTNLVTANLQSNAASVSAGEFSNCTSLTTVTNLSTVQDIGASAFYQCGALSDIGTAGSLSNVQSIGANAFTDCISLTELGGLDSLITVGDRAFLNCAGIPKLENVNKVQTIGNSAFENCTAIAEVGTLDALISVGNSAFKNCSKVPAIGNASNLETIGNSAFENCTALVELGDIPKVTSIGNSAFMNCNNLTGIGEAPAIISIGSSAFKNCSALSEFVIPEGVTAINTSTFENCTSLQEAVIESVKTIGSNAYRGCTALKSATPVSGVNSVGSSAFEDCSSLVYGPVSARSMGSRAFANCTSLQSIPNNVNFSSLGSYAFLNCSSMEGTLQINAAVTKIPEGVFKGCTGLTNLYLHGKLTEIGAHAFEGCSGIVGVSNLSIAKDLMNIRSCAFKDCTSLTSIALPSDMFYSENVSKCGLPIEAYAFYNTGLTSLKLPQKTFGAGNFAFGECKNLKSVTLYASDRNNYSATTFYGCDGIHFTINNLSFKPSAAPWGASNCTYSCRS